MEVNYFEGLPLDIKVDIFKYLDLEVVESQLVCKDWRNVIRKNVKEEIIYGKIKHVYIYLFWKFDKDVANFDKINHELYLSMKFLNKEFLRNNMMALYFEERGLSDIKDYEIDCEKIFNLLKNIEQITFINKTRAKTTDEYSYEIFKKIFKKKKIIDQITFVKINVSPELRRFIKINNVITKIIHQVI